MKMHLSTKSRRKPSTVRPLTRSRGRVFETLEGRALLAADGQLASPWQNHFRAEDVNNDFLVTPADVLKVIDAINRRGISRLDFTASGTTIRGSSDPDQFGTAQYVDVSGDGLLSPVDVLRVIHVVNQAVGDPDTMDLTAQAFDLAHNPITEIVVGTDFLIGLTAKDSRPTPSGVFSAYADVTLDNAALASFNSGPLSSGFVLTFDPEFSTARAGQVVPPTLVDDAGAVDITPPDSNDAGNAVLIWTTTMKANAAGTMTFTPDPSDNPLVDDLLVHSPNDPSSPAVGSYLPTSLTAVAEVVPLLFINDVSVTEGDISSTTATFTVTLLGVTTRDVYVIYSTTDNTATAGNDYTAQISRTLTFLAGQTQQTVDVPVLGDDLFEDNETFNVNLLFASNATISDGIGVGTIVEDDIGPTVSISDQQLVEGNAGTTNMVFDVTLDIASSSDVVVNYSTQDGTATQPSDYTSQVSPLTFTAGQTSRQITVPIIGDVAFENNEDFTVNLLTATNATIGDGVGIGTILNDDLGPTLTISDEQLVEGNSGKVNMVFTVTLAPTTVLDVVVDFSTQNNTALAGSDYDGTTGQLTFVAGQSSKQILVPINGDMLFESSETFFLNLTAATNATIGDGVGLGTIVDDDGAPVVTVSDAQHGEGDVGDMTFTVTLSPSSLVNVIVGYSTQDGSAIAGADYSSRSDQVTFTPGQTSKQITVPILEDTVFENDETFTLRLASASNAVIGDGVGVGTIVDNDPAPLLSVSDAQIVEGDSSTTSMVFVVTLSPGSSANVIVGYSTENDTATAPADFTAQSAQLTFAPGQTTKQVTVPIVGDLLNEGTEQFSLNLSSPVGAVIIDDRGVGTIIDNDLQGYSVNDVQLLEGNSGTTNAVFTVTLSTEIPTVSTVVFTTGAAGDTATPDVDYQPVTTTLTFLPGETSKTVTVKVNGETVVEPDELFTVTLSNPTDPLDLIDATATGTIFDDDGQHPPLVRFRFEVLDDTNTVIPDGGEIDVNENFTLKVYVDDVSATDEGVLSAYLDVVYSEAILNAVGPITFSPLYTTARTGNFSTDGLIDEAGAVDGATPLGPSEQFLFSIPMTTHSSGLATFSGEPADRPGSDVVLYFSDGATVPLNQIDYGFFTLSVGSNAFQIDSISSNEGNASETDFVFTVTRFNPDPTPASVVFSTGNGTATLSDNDYDATSGTLNFAIGETQKTVTVKVNGDLKSEANETFTVTLSGATGATIGQAIGTGTILNDDGVPTVSIADATGAETANLSFVVSLSAVSGQQITVLFNTAPFVGPNAATPGTDFTPTSGTLTFAPGETTKTISVAAISDIVSPEPNETFLVQLGAPVNAAIADSTGVGTILDAPPAGISGFVYVDADDDGVKDAGEPGLRGVIVTVALEDGTLTRTATTDAAGAYQFLLLPPGRYFVTETQPGFYIDGKDTPANLVVANDKFFVDSAINPSSTNLNFGEKGILPEFLAVALNRRIFFATTVGNGVNGLGSPIVNADLTRGDIWISFDAGWDGLRKFQAFFNSGNVTLKLYDFDFRGDLHLLATSQLVNGRPEIGWVDAPETPAKPLFLQISGTSIDASVKIIDTLRVATQSVAEGNSGLTNATLTLKLSGPQTAPVTVQYATANNTAVSPADYAPTSGTLTFATGETSKQITVPIVGDLLDEDNESFFVNLTNISSFVEVAPGPLAITITDNDQAPKLNVGDVTIAEGNGGSVSALFTVSLSAPSGRQVTVAYTTAAGTASANGDFTPASGTLTFAAGVLAQNIAVPILGDTFLEGDETFSIVLGTAVNASILDGVGLGTITNDDAGPQLFSVSQPAGQSGSGLLAYTESSEGASTSEVSTESAPASSSAIPAADDSSRPLASRSRTKTSAVDAAMEEEDNWSLVA